MGAINVLIVEDEAIFAEVLKSFLIDRKLNVMGVFDNVKDSLEFIKKNSIDFVFIDIYLRGNENGIQLSKELKKMDIPFMFITAISEEKTMELAKKEGSYGYIIKPIDLSQLGISIDIAISQAQTHKRLKKEKRNIENKLRDMLDTLQIMMVELDLDYGIKFMTNLVRERFKVTSLWNKTFLDFFADEQKKIIREKLERVKSGEVITLNTVMNNGEKNLPVFFRFSPIIEEEDEVFEIKGIRVLIINIMDVISEFVMPNEEFFREYSLSARETEIVKCIIKFQSNNEIAKSLYISIPTVKFHIKNIYSKLKVKNRRELIERLKNYYFKNFGNECYSMYLLNILLEN
ncbi:MAG: DNA-binding response regulator [Brevinematales bacterium]|nr:DNA-binding response regulator [Brevinematales bacterium]